MKILITGGAGYIGTELAYALANNDTVKEVVIYDNLSRGNYNLFLGHHKFPKNRIRHLQADILDTRKLRKAVAECDVVYHLAAKVTTPFADAHPHLFEQLNHWGTAEVVYAAEATQLDKFIYISSVSVYGSADEEVSVGSPLNPRTLYGMSKMRGEDHVRRLLEKQDGCIIRCGNVYGYSKSMRFDAMINRFLFEANFSNRITINGDGDQCRSFIHINKAVDVLSGLIEEPLATGTYDLVEHILSVNDVALELREIFPDLEMLFVNQHMKLRQLKVKADAEINKRFKRKDSFSEELENFKKEFSF